MGFFDKVKEVLTSSDAERARSAGRASDEAAATTAPSGEEPAREEAAAQEEQSGARELRTHTVERGDTLVGIAEQYGVDWRELAALNQLDNPDLIYPGQVFRLPDA